MTDLRWHVAHTNANAERMAEKRLRQLGYDVIYLHRHELRRHGNRKVEVVAAFFPRYLFLARQERQGLMDANTCIGVSTVLHTAGAPQIVPESLIAGFRRMVDKAEPALNPMGEPCAISGCLGRPGPKPRTERDPYRKGEEVEVVLVDGWTTRGIVRLDRGRTVRVALQMFRAVVVADVEPDRVRRPYHGGGAMQPARPERAFS